MALLGVTVGAQTLGGEALVAALQGGGYVIVVRHAHAPAQPPDPQTADPGNVNRERQLDAAGRAGATAMGRALRALKIPIGEVLTSPTYRARETARLAGLSNPRAVEELGDNGRSMQGVTETQAAWLRRRVTQFSKGTNTVIVTHQPNMALAFPQAAGLVDGEALVFGPDGKGGAALVARVPIDAWSKLPGAR